MGVAEKWCHGLVEILEGAREQRREEAKDVSGCVEMLKAKPLLTFSIFPWSSLATGRVNYINGHAKAGALNLAYVDRQQRTWSTEERDNVCSSSNRAQVDVRGERLVNKGEG